MSTTNLPPGVTAPISNPIGQSAAAVVEAAPINNLAQGENIMAEVDTSMLAGQHADIRREGSEHTAEIRYDVATRAGDLRHETAVGFDKTGDLIAAVGSDIRLEQQKQAFDLSHQSGAETNEIVKEGLKSAAHTTDVVKDSRYETVSRVEGAADRLDAAINNANFNLSSRVENAQDRTAKDIADLRGTMADRFFTVGRDVADNRAQINALGFQVRDGFAQSAAIMENAVLKSTIEGHKNTQYLSDKIALDGEKTRGLINDLKYHDLNRSLVERNAALVNCEQDRHSYRDRWLDGRFDQNQAQFAGQWAQLQNQVQAFASQLQETRQGMVNFGTMAGVGQSSTSNNVR